jgi:hypothetical protein
MLSVLARSAMKSSSILSRLLSRRSAVPDKARLRVQPIGFSDVQTRQLKLLCARIGESLDLWLEIDARHGDIVLAEPGFAARLPPRQLARMVDARPLLRLDLSVPDDPAAGALSLFENRQQELLALLRELPVVRGLSPQFGASGWDPSLLEVAFLPSGYEEAALGLDAPAFSASQSLLVTSLLRGLMDSTMRPLVAGYGPMAMLRVDFAQGYALVDPLAQQALRVRRELPAVMTSGVPGSDAIERDLRELVWDCGIAAAPCRLLDQPLDWWHTPLGSCADPGVQRFTRLPRHLDMAAVLFRQRVSPAELQQRTGHTVAQMRPFLQACLFLGLAWWSPQS